MQGAVGQGGVWNEPQQAKCSNKLKTNSFIASRPFCDMLQRTRNVLSMLQTCRDRQMQRCSTTQLVAAQVAFGAKTAPQQQMCLSGLTLYLYWNSLWNLGLLSFLIGERETEKVPWRV